MAKLPTFIVRRSHIAGRGAFATRIIPKGTRIVEYIGERISHEEADRRYESAAARRRRRHHTMLFAVSANACIDATRRGNEARYINHSCAPNCEAIQEAERVFIFARRNIVPGDELTYDYRFERELASSLAEAKRKYPCRCGASTCRGTIVRPSPKRRKKRAS